MNEACIRINYAGRNAKRPGYTEPDVCLGPVHTPIKYSRLGVRVPLSIYEKLTLRDVDQESSVTVHLN